MAKHKYPPRGYNQFQYPLPHNFGYQCGLSAEGSTKDSTIFTLFRASEAAVDVENIEVNPRHANFSEDGGTVIHMGSIIPKIQFHLKMMLSKVAIETDSVRSLIVRWWPIYISFLDSLEAEDDKTATQVEDLLELQHSTDNKDTFPLYTGTKLGNAATVPLSTVPYAEAFADQGLTGTQFIESVALVEHTLYDALQFYTNQGMLRKCLGKAHYVTLTRDRPYQYSSFNFTNPKVKRGNAYTYCGILIHVPQVDDNTQVMVPSETTAIDHVNVFMRVRYDEWNPLFEQAQI